MVMMLAWQKKWSKIAKVWDARFSRDGDAARPGAGEASWQARLLAPDTGARLSGDGTEFWSLHVMLWELMLSDADATGKIICIYI
jgi:hypothetical protein